MCHNVASSNPTSLEDESASDALPMLRDANVQDIQLELIRRSRYNAFDGRKVSNSLLRHRTHWLAVVLDRVGISHPDLIKRATCPLTSGTPTLYLP